MEMGSSSIPPSDADGLSFGKKIYFEDGGSGKKVKGAAPARCQVEGCHVDLTGVKAYYCKHKVCGMHSKAPVVTVGGMERRFCQQCSRFHQLSEFDQGKRSCRRRLAGHNERRRKPPHGSLSVYGYHPSSFREGQYRSVLMDFTCPKLPTSAIEEWPIVKPSERVSTYLSQQRLDAPQGAAAVQETHTYVRSRNPAAELPPDLRFAGVPNTSCALSLLSTQPWGTNASRIRAAPSSANNSFDGAPMAQPNVGSYMNSPWSFKAHEAISSSHDVQHEMGLASGEGSCRYSGELELALQGDMPYPDLGLSRASDQGHGIHWSL